MELVDEDYSAVVATSAHRRSNLVCPLSLGSKLKTAMLPPFQLRS